MTKDEAYKFWFDMIYYDYPKKANVIKYGGYEESLKEITAFNIEASMTITNEVFIKKLPKHTQRFG